MINRIVNASENRLGYLLFHPEVTEDLPLLIYLHGAGERGEKSDHLYRHGVPKLLNEGREIPAVVLCPQCPVGFVWNNVVVRVKSLIDETVEQFGIKRDRIVITGSSMGGYGTWEMGLTYRSFFAAVAPVAGGGMGWRTAGLRTTPVFAFHGSEDDVVLPNNSKEMVDLVNKNGGKATLTILEGYGHNDGIDYAYRSTNLLERLLEMRRTDFGYVPDVCEDCY